MKYTSPAALPASDAAWIMLKEVMPSGEHAAQFAVKIGLARAERRHGRGDRRGTPIARPPICDWSEEARLRRWSHPMDPRTVPLYVPREDRELVTNARCTADVDDKV